MTPPINIDGSQVSGVTIDGADVSAVTVDGTTVFGAAPDSAIHRWKFDEGSGMTASDSIGSADLSLNFSNWISDVDAVGSYVLGFDGSNDEGTATVDISNESEVLLCLTLETSANSGRNYAAGWGESGSFGTIRGGLEADNALFDPTDGSNLNRLTGTSTITDGNKHRLAFGIIQNDTALIAVDSTQEASTSYSTFGPVSDSFVVGRNPTGSSAYLGGNYDDVIVYNDASQSTIDADYDIQPWS